MKTVNFPEQAFAFACIVSFLCTLNAIFSLVPNQLSKSENWTMFYWSGSITFVCAYFAIKLHRKHHPFLKKNDASPPTS
ncbi:MAG: hypothetical protein JJE53_01630 [Candidatus Pacebacteria bacterium]|nr:hypothetical protein [Candidatus Paceibacterota bacterium]